jgi:glucosamine kinase
MNEPATVFIGIDGGGTRARAVAVDASGAVVRRADGPAGIVDARAPEQSAAVVAGLVHAVAGSAAVGGVCCGLAGAGRERERVAVAALLASAGVQRVHVVSDAEVAMEDAFGGEAGVLLIAGTGSIAWARDGAGHSIRVGGWGQLLGDEGSGYAIGLAGLRAVVRAADGRASATSLTHVLLSATQCAEPGELILFAEAAAKADVAALAPHVLAQAATDDAAATIRVDAVSALLDLVETAVHRAALDAPRVALTGGLIGEGGALRADVERLLSVQLPGCRLHAGTVDGARGAARLALGLAARW